MEAEDRHPSSASPSAFNESGRIPHIMSERTHTRTASHRILASFRRTATTYPRLWISFCCFWLWPWLLSNTIRRSYTIQSSDESLFWTHTWLSVFLVLAIALLATAVRYWRTGRVTSQNANMMASAIALPIAGVTAFAFCLSQPEASAAWWTVSLVWSVLGGLGLALLCLIWGRAFGDAGARPTLFIGVASTVVSGALALGIINAPLAFAQAALVVVPIVSVGLLARDLHRHPDRYDGNARAAGSVPNAASDPALRLAQPSIPWKLLITVSVWACAFGAAARVFDSSSLWATVGVPAYILAAVLLVICALWLEIDFNHLIYKMGFVVMAGGLLLILLAQPLSSIGYGLFNVGYRFIELLVWGLCAHLAYTRKIEPVWIVALNVGVWTLGRYIGFVGASAVLEVAPDPMSSGGIVLACLFALLVAALFLASSNNLVEGWGIERVDSDSRSANLVRLGCEQLAEQRGLSPREQDILIATAQGLTRAEVAETLTISEETVKTHLKHIYRKLGIASKDELIALANEAADPLGNDFSLADDDR